MKDSSPQDATSDQSLVTWSDATDINIRDQIEQFVEKARADTGLEWSDVEIESFQKFQHLARLAASASTEELLREYRKVTFNQIDKGFTS
ncbi:MAG: hypothetical protein DWQ31_16655 [Planctomycetota bacterium]|nr:MAG: hypothetical protein DWQ31_16655 [Planctomycetota bacterium]